MSQDREVMQQALEALRHGVRAINYLGGAKEAMPLHEAIFAIDAALARPDTAPNLACKSVQARLAEQWGYVRAQPPQPQAVEGWRELYRRAINEANGLTNYVEDRPELRRAERNLAAIEAEARALDAAPPQQPTPGVHTSTAPQRGRLTDEQIEQLRGLDTDKRVRFYEHDFYVLSNFSAFTLYWCGHRFDTSEAAYHWEKFPAEQDIRDAIRCAPSAHEAFKIAERNKAARRPDWDEVKLDIMRGILRAKADQHLYVRRKLLATGDRELVEDSWRDDFWGWGPSRDGRNWLGRLWMEVRAELRAHGITGGSV